MLAHLYQFRSNLTGWNGGGVNRKNRVAEAVERRILELAVDQPAWGHTRMANELAKEGIRVSPTGVRGVWVRHDLNTVAKRLKALEAKVAQDGS